MVKKWKNVRWKKWHYPTSLGKKYKPPSEQDIDELMKKLGTSLRPSPDLKDERTCALCGCLGDGDTNGPARLVFTTVTEQGLELKAGIEAIMPLVSLNSTAFFSISHALVHWPEMSALQFCLIQALLQDQ